MRGYKPALDGIRALAVIAVLLFHGEAGAPGGFLGVSVFFTLSGYLITSLLLAEHARTGTIGLREFYSRRLRRLMPAAFVCFALVLALGPWWTATQRRDLPGDLLAALLDVANWRFAFANTSYEELFIGAPSPVAHFWSLAIEEQFYVFLPLIATVALGRSRRTFAVTAWALLGTSIAATVLTTDRDLVYNGTHTRAAELLFGVVLAMLPLRRRSVQRVLRIAAPVALAALIVVVVKATVADDWLYDGGLVFVGLTSAVLVGGVAHGGPLARVLGNPTLAAVGRISYGLYLFHWPIFLVLSESRVGVGGAPLLVLRLAASFAAAAVSYRILELPVRHRRLLPRPGPAGLAAGGSLAALALAAFVAVPSPRFTETEELLQEGAAGEVISLTPTTDASGRLLSDEAEAVLSGSSRSPTGGGTGDGDGAAPSTRVTVPEPTVGVGVPGTDDGTETTRSRPRGAPSTAAPTTVTATTPSTTAAPSTTLPPRPPRVLVVGSDESPLAALTARGYDVVDGLQRGCPIATAVEVQLDDGTVVPTAACEPSAAQWARVAGAASPDLVVVSTGPLDRGATRAAGDAGFARADDLVARARRLDAEESDLRAAIDAVTGGGAAVWIVDHRGDRPKGVFDERLARVALSDQNVRDVVAGDVDLVESIDRAVSGEAAVRAIRVLVVGDSVSLNFARSLADAVPGALDVAWAGENGCPFVRARAIRVAPSDPWEDNRCTTFDQKLPPILAEFEPDVVVMMVSLRELVEQRYPGDDAPHVAGDPGFTAFHDSEMAELVALLEQDGIPLLVTDSPPIVAGAMATTAMAHPARIEAWNAQVHRWADSWPSVALLEYAAPLIAFEAAHGSIRADGVHPEIDPLTELAREVFVPAVVSSTRALQAARAGAAP